MDNFCINLGTLLDNPSVQTLERPDVHTVHCLVDVGICRDSGFVGRLYTKGYATDTAGTTMLIDVAWSIGDSSTCTTTSGGLVAGFRAGIGDTLIDANAVPPLISVTTATYVLSSTHN